MARDKRMPGTEAAPFIMVLPIISSSQEKKKDVNNTNSQGTHMTMHIHTPGLRTDVIHRPHAKIAEWSKNGKYIYMDRKLQQLTPLRVHRYCCPIGYIANLCMYGRLRFRQCST